MVDSLSGNLSIPDSHHLEKPCIWIYIKENPLISEKVIYRAWRSESVTVYQCTEVDNSGILSSPHHWLIHFYQLCSSVILQGAQGDSLLREDSEMNIGIERKQATITIPGLVLHATSIHLTFIHSANICWCLLCRPLEREVSEDTVKVFLILWKRQIGKILPAPKTQGTSCLYIWSKPLFQGRQTMCNRQCFSRGFHRCTKGLKSGPSFCFSPPLSQMRPNKEIKQKKNEKWPKDALK